MDESKGDGDNGANGKAKFDRGFYIDALNKIDQNIVKLLRSAGEAVQALTIQSDNSQFSTDDRKAAFTRAVSDYFAALSYVDVNLRRQIYALEEANIIPTETPKENVTTDGAGSIGSGATGVLDIGWLNSRNDRVGTDMEQELWAQAKELLKGFDLEAIFASIEDTNTAVP